MNIDQANRIPMSALLEKIGYKPVRGDNIDGTYLSPLREEKTASFHVNYIKNVWYDHGIDQGGDVINFVCRWLKSQRENDTEIDALRWVKIMSGNMPFIQPVKDASELMRANDKKLSIKSTSPIQHPALLRYLENRGVDLHFAKTLLKQVQVFNKGTGKTMFALGMENENGGHELRNQIFKGCAGEKTITFVRGYNPNRTGIHLFEGKMDYLTFITIMKRRPADDTIILNSLSCLKDATPYIQGYGYRMAYTWMDNDPAGKKATKALDDFFKTEESLLHKPMNSVYAPFKDINEWHMHNLNLN